MVPLLKTVEGNRMGGEASTRDAPTVVGRRKQSETDSGRSVCGSSFALCGFPVLGVLETGMKQAGLFYLALLKVEFVVGFVHTLKLKE